MLWADVGAGKTSISLTAFVELQKAGLVKRGLVMATVRICQLTWRQEAAKWSHTRHLRIEFLHGPNKDKILADGLALQPGLGGVDLFLINYEGLPWLCGKYTGKNGGLPFDTIIADELTKLKNSTGLRAKALRKSTLRTSRKWGLTGTPAPNGYLDLFGQFLWIDGGASLGLFYSHYRDNYFQPEYDGFSYKIQRDGEKRIKDRIKNIVYRLEYTDLPAIRDNNIMIQLDAKARKSYDTMKKEMLLQIEGNVITAGNAAAAYTKLKQMANGAVYTADTGGKREYVVLHEAKLDALCELIESLQGQPLLIAYQFQHDLERIQERLKAEFGWDAPYLGSGVSEKDAIRLQNEWNKNKLPVMLCQPQSVGHGLNFQEGGAGHLCWFSSDFNLETYSQFIGRIRRKGNASERVVNHRLIVTDSIDEIVYAALEDKDTTQVRLLQGLRQILQSTTPRPAALGKDTEDDMTILRRLPTQGTAPAAAQPTQQRAAAPQPAQAPAAAAPARIQPRGWGQQAAAAQAAPPASPQAAAIQTKLQGEPQMAASIEAEDEEQVSLVDAAADHIAAAMGQAIQSDDDGDPNTPPPPVEAPAPKATRGRPKAQAAAQPVQPVAAPVIQEPAASTFSVGMPAEVSINFNGAPDAVVAAMLKMIAAFKAS